MLTVTIKGQFESAVKLYNYSGRCATVHGHTYRVAVTFYNNDQSSDMVVDYYDAKTWVENAIAPLDHQLINEIKPFDETSPTTENIAKWLHQKISHQVTKNIAVQKIVISENDNFSVTYETNNKNT